MIRPQLARETRQLLLRIVRRPTLSMRREKDPLQVDLVPSARDPHVDRTRPDAGNRLGPNKAAVLHPVVPTRETK